MAFLLVVHQTFDQVHVPKTSEEHFFAGLPLPAIEELAIWCLIYILLYLNASLGDVRDVDEDRLAGVPTLPAFTGQAGSLCFIGFLSTAFGVLLLAQGRVHLSLEKGCPDSRFVGSSVEMASAYLWTTVTVLWVGVHLRRGRGGRQIYNAGDLALFLPFLVHLLVQKIIVH